VPRQVPGQSAARNETFLSLWKQDRIRGRDAVDHRWRNDLDYHIARVIGEQSLTSNSTDFVIDTRNMVVEIVSPSVIDGVSTPNPILLPQGEEGLIVQSAIHVDGPSQPRGLQHRLRSGVGGGSQYLQ
jgi:hypothetical protein